MIRRWRHDVLQIIFPLLVLTSSVASAWPPGGVAVAPLPLGLQAEPRLLLGRNGAVLAFWSDARWLDGYYDLYGQLLTRTGLVSPGWADTGLMIVRAWEDQRPLSGLSAPDGSFILGFTDARDFCPGCTGGGDPITRVLPSGEIDPTWPRHGFQATGHLIGAAGRMVWVAPDTLVTCSRYRYPDDTFGTFYQKVAVTPAGPQSLWGPDGIAQRWRPKTLLSTVEIVPDGAGGFFEVFDEWLTPLSVPFTVDEIDLYVIRVGRDGQPAPGWEAGAKPITTAPGGQGYGAACADGAGGLFVAWADSRDGQGLVFPDYLPYLDIRMLRLTADGAIHPGWPAEGLVISDAPGEQFLPFLLPDGAGGVFVSWQDQTIGLTHVRPDGTFAPGWAKNGIQVSDLPAYTQYSKLVMDGRGGVFVLFADIGQNDLYLQHVLASGHVDPLWPSAGRRLSVAGDGDIVSDGEGGCYVAYLTQVVPMQPYNSVYVNRFSVDGVVPVKLAEATVEAEAGRVLLVWRGTGAGASELAVERRAEGEGWQRLGVPTARGRDAVEYEDLAVAPGASYTYRLVRGAEVMSEEASVTVPATAEFALAGAWPNPVLSRELSVVFTLTGAAPAKLEILDLAGRREHERALLGLGAGRHVVGLGEARLVPGMHWLRLTEGARTALARVVVIE